MAQNNLLPVDIPRVYITGSSPQPDDNQLPVASPYVDPNQDQQPSITDKLFGLNGTPRYQLWPERMIREALSAPHDAMNSSAPVTSSDLIKPAVSMSALAGSGGLGGVGEGADAALGAGPFLRPALKYQGKIYKAPVGGQHLDAIPPNLRNEFTKQAMSGEDISNFDFGFMNHKGHFLSREDALKYAIDEGLLSPHDAKFGALTSTLMADSSKEATAIDAVSKQPFYSALEKNINNIDQSKMTGEQWLGTLANKPGVKPEEMQHTGLQDFLASKGKEPVTKAEIQQHLNDNKIQLNDVVKGGNVDFDKVKPDQISIDKYKNQWDYLVNQRRDLTKDNPYRFDDKTDAIDAQLDNLNHQMVKETIDRMGGLNSPTKYSSYQLPGGENYREHLITLPDRQAQLENYNKSNRLTDAETKELIELQRKNGVSGRDIYRSSHWDEPNVLAHIRTNDRTIDGKKSLHVEEIQSDWHQEGRKKGYSNGQAQKAYDDYEANLYKRAKENWYNDAKGLNLPQDKMDAIYAKTLKDHPSWVQSKYLNEEAKHKEMWDAAQAEKSGVPDAPFKKSWDELALKHVINHAVRNGYDQISWTPGEAQAARYDLSKQIDKVHYNPELKTVAAYKNGNMIVNKSGVEPKDLPDVIGKEAADKIMNNPTRKAGDTHELSGIDLKVGGEGMKAFYDKMLVDKMNAISKKYGGEKVGKSELAKAKPYVDQFGKTKYDPMEVHTLKITPEFRKQVLSKGFPLFSDTSIPASAIRSKEKR